MVNNDLALAHEQAPLDVAAGQEFLRESDFETIVLLSHPGGGTLFAHYQKNADRPPEQRLRSAPGGRPTGFAELDVTSDAMIFLAPHPDRANGCSATSTPPNRHRSRS